MRHWDGPSGPVEKSMIKPSIAILMGLTAILGACAGGTHNSTGTIVSGQSGNNANSGRPGSRRPDRGAGAVLVAMRALRQRNYGNALSASNYAIHQGNLSPRALSAAYTIRGFANLRIGGPAASYSDFNQAIRIDARNYIALQARGWMRMRQKKYRAAAADMTRSIQIKPNHMTYYFRGLAYGFSGAHSRALADFNRAIDMRPDWPGSYFARGVTFVALRNLARAPGLPANASAQTRSPGRSQRSDALEKPALPAALSCWTQNRDAQDIAATFRGYQKIASIASSNQCSGQINGYNSISKNEPASQ